MAATEIKLQKVELNKGLTLSGSRRRWIRPMAPMWTSAGQDTKTVISERQR